MARSGYCLRVYDFVMTLFSFSVSDGFRGPNRVSGDLNCKVGSIWSLSGVGKESDILLFSALEDSTSIAGLFGEWTDVADATLF